MIIPSLFDLILIYCSMFIGLSFFLCFSKQAILSKNPIYRYLLI